jgi:putative transposase
MCRVLRVHPSGFYAWLKKPLSDRAIEDERLLKLIQSSFIASGGTYGSPMIHQDLREQGERCGVHRVARIMRQAGIRAEIGYKRRSFKGGKPAVVADNRLNRQFTVDEPDRAWVTDITYIRTYEGWTYLAVVIDLFSRLVVGWSMQPRLRRDLVLQSLLSAVWRRKPIGKVLVHSDQGSQYSSDDTLRFLKAHNLEPSMSRRGNCHDNAVAESFFHTLKTERIKRRIYRDRAEARQDVFDYIELFYNPRRRHSHLGRKSPMVYEQEYFQSMESV